MLTQKLTYSSHINDAVQCQFLITHLKSGSLPEFTLSSARKAQKNLGSAPNSFQSEIAALHSIFEELDNPQCAMIKAGHITWDCQSATLLALYAEVLKTYSIILPRAEMTPFRACELIRIIMLRNQELGAELYDMVEHNILELDEWKILKEAQAWIERKATSYLGSRHQS